MFIEKMVLDKLLEQRRSIREFDITELPEEKIEAVIEAGRLAPFAGLVQKNTDNTAKAPVIHQQITGAFWCRQPESNRHGFKAGGF